MLRSASVTIVEIGGDEFVMSCSYTYWSTTGRQRVEMPDIRINKRHIAPLPELSGILQILRQHCR